MKILVTGTGRSGTTFVASTLGALGISATHERVYQVGKCHQDWPEHPHVEVSWAAPKYRSAWPDDLTVLHLVRHPFRTIESYLNVMKGAGAGWYQNHWKLAEMIPPYGAPPTGQYRPDFQKHKWSDNDWVAWHYIEWSRLVERYAGGEQFQVEESEAIFDEVFRHLGRGCDDKSLEEAMGKANRNSVNAGANKITGLEAFAEELRGPLEQIAKDYGYDLDEC